METEFTPGAKRVLAEAGWWSGGDDSEELSAQSLLLGLLGERDCLAAIVLARYGIDSGAVCGHWPDFVRLDAPPPTHRFSTEVEASLAVAVARLQDCPRPLVLATEHVLLGLAAADHETARWLRERGLDPDTLEAEIHRRYGHRPGPLTVDQEPLELRLPPAAEPATEDLPERDPPQAPSETSAAQTTRFLRVVDAAANRAREGLRVVEDYVRFVLDDPHLTGRLKRLRHDLTAILARISIGDRLAARETQADVGTGLSTAGERRREGVRGVLTANFTRLQESLRSLEEFGKLLDPDLAAQLQQLRYRAYTLQRAVEITETSRDRLAGSRLYVLIDGRPTAEQFKDLAWSLVDAGVHVLQLRDKWLDDRRLYERARLLRQITRSSNTLFIMNDRPDLAVVTHADGVHVGQEELTVKDARTVVGPDALIGVSTHSIEQAQRAVLDGANYLGVGPTFPSDTKQFEQFPGVELLRTVAEEIRLPAFAIGGITRENVPQVLATGFRRIAVSRAVAAAADPATAARELLARLGE